MLLFSQEGWGFSSRNKQGCIFWKPFLITQPNSAIVFSFFLFAILSINSKSLFSIYAWSKSRFLFIGHWPLLNTAKCSKKSYLCLLNFPGDFAETELMLPETGLCEHGLCDTSKRVNLYMATASLKSYKQCNTCKL